MSEVGSIAPIATVMLLKRRLLCKAAAFEWKAGSPLPICFTVPLLKY